MSDNRRDFIEIGNRTIKLARRVEENGFRVTRYDDVLELGEEIINSSLCHFSIVPTAEARLTEVLGVLPHDCGARIINRHDLTGFIGESYDTPETLGLDRMLQLHALDDDGIVVSCGTAITIDARANGRPLWGAILPGFSTAAKGLHAHAPALPIVGPHTAVGLPAHSTMMSIANGVLLGTALAAYGVIDMLCEAGGIGADVPIYLTGGEVYLFMRFWKHGRVVIHRDDLVFVGAEKVSAGINE